MAGTQETGNGKKVVVIGGGVAGSLAAKSLQFVSQLTLIDPYVSFLFNLFIFGVLGFIILSLTFQ